MRSFLKIFAQLVIVLALIAAAFGLVLLFADQKAEDAIIFAIGISGAFLGGILWMLTEISEQLGKLPEDMQSAKTFTEMREANVISVGSASVSRSPR